MGGNDFNVGHTGVTARQTAGTLEREVKYDQEAFKKAWDYLAASPSDSEEDYNFFFFFPATLFLAPQVSWFYCGSPSVLILVFEPQVYWF